MAASTVALIVLFAAWGALLAWSAIGGLGPVLRIYHDHTSAVDQLAEGPAEVAGALRAVEGALATFDGTPVLALHTVLGCSYKRGSKTYSAPGDFAKTEFARVELSDGTGSCVLEMDQVVLIGPTLEREWVAEDFAAAHPELYAALAAKRGEEERITKVRARQRYVPDGARGFVSGVATPDDSVAPGADYRSLRRRWRLRGTERRPLVLSAWSEADARYYLTRPLVTLAWLAALCWACAGAVAFTWSTLARAAGL